MCAGWTQNKTHKTSTPERKTNKWCTCVLPGSSFNLKFPRRPSPLKRMWKLLSTRKIFCVFEAGWRREGPLPPYLWTHTLRAGGKQDNPRSMPLSLSASPSPLKLTRKLQNTRWNFLRLRSKAAAHYEGPSLPSRVSMVLAFLEGLVLRSFSPKRLRTGPGPVLIFTI